MNWLRRVVLMKAGDPWARPRNDEAMAMSRSEAADLILLTKSIQCNRKIRKIHVLSTIRAWRRPDAVIIGRKYMYVEIKHLFDFMRCSCQANQDTAGPESDAPPLPSTY